MSIRAYEETYFLIYLDASKRCRWIISWNVSLSLQGHLTDGPKGKIRIFFFNLVIVNDVVYQVVLDFNFVRKIYGLFL